MVQTTQYFELFGKKTQTVALNEKSIAFFGLLILARLKTKMTCVIDNMKRN